MIVAIVEVAAVSVTGAVVGASQENPKASHKTWAYDGMAWSQMDDASELKDVQAVGLVGP